MEAILKSRPLTAPSSDVNESSALTPSPFVIGRPLTALPEPSQEDIEKLVRGLFDISSTSTKMAE